MGREGAGHGSDKGEEPSAPSPFSAAPVSDSRWRFLPLVGQLRGYTTLRPDVLAGVMIAALAVPQAMAYAQTAGLPVVAGLYGLLLPVLAYALLGSSRVLMTGPTTTAALMVAPALAAITSDPEAWPALAAMLALLVGAVFALAGVLRLGWVADYFSSAVLLGFVTGLGLTLIAGQLGQLTGVEVTGDNPLQQYASFLTNAYGGVHALTLAIGLLCLVLLLAGGRWAPRFPMLLVITVGSILASWAFDLSERGVTVVGTIPPGLPELAWPDVPLADAAQLLPAAIGIALVGFSDAILTARSLAASGGGPVSADQELAALSASNIAAGLSQSFPGGSSGSRSAVNVRVGGRTQVVSLSQAATVVVVLLFLTPALAYLPKAVLAAVITYAALGLVDVPGWIALARGSRVELAIAGVTVFCMLTVGLLPALLLAVLLSVLDVVRRSAEPRDAVLGWGAEAGRFVDVERHPEAWQVPGAVVYRLDDRLFFANSTYFAARIDEAVRGAQGPVQVVVFDAESVSHLDSSGAEVLRTVIADLAARDIRFVLARSRSRVDDQIEQLGLGDVLPTDARFPTVRSAVLGTTGVDVGAGR